MLSCLQIKSSFTGLKTAHTLQLRGSFSCRDEGRLRFHTMSSSGDRSRSDKGQDFSNGQLRKKCSPKDSDRRTHHKGFSRDPRKLRGCNAFRELSVISARSKKMFRPSWEGRSIGKGCHITAVQDANLGHCILSLQQVECRLDCVPSEFTCWSPHTRCLRAEPRLEIRSL